MFISECSIRLDPLAQNLAYVLLHHCILAVQGVDLSLDFVHVLPKFGSTVMLEMALILAYFHLLRLPRKIWVLQI